MGQCGTGDRPEVTELCEVPLEVPSVRQMACGLDHTIFVMAEGSVWGCGWGADGQIGCDSYDNHVTVQQVADVKAKRVFAGADTSFVITDGDVVLSWGNNEYRQLGIDSTEPQLPSPHPVGVASLDGCVTDIAAGTAFTGFLTQEGSVYVCGYQIERGGTDDDPTLRHQFRCLHDGRACGRVKCLNAGLHYLVATSEEDESRKTVWGKCVIPGSTNSYHSATKFSLGSSVIGTGYGSLGLTLLSTCNSSHKLISLN